MREGKEFGIKQSRFDVNLPAMIALEEQPDTIPII